VLSWELCGSLAVGGRGEMGDGWGVGGLVRVFQEGYKSRSSEPSLLLGFTLWSGSVCEKRVC